MNNSIFMSANCNREEGILVYYSGKKGNLHGKEYYFEASEEGYRLAKEFIARQSRSYWTISMMEKGHVRKDKEAAAPVAA